MRTLSAGEVTALSASPLPLVILVEIDLTSTLYLCTAGMDLLVSGNTYLGAGGLGRIDAVQDSPAEIKSLSFQLSGVPSSQVSLVLTEPVQGCGVRIKSLLLDPATYQPLTPRLRWQGRGDVMSLEDGPDTASIRFSAEHGAIDLLRGAPAYWSDSEQRRLFSADPSLQYLVDQVDQRVVWPAASFGRQ